MASVEQVPLSVEGKLVAFEGDVQAVATQLRLLPSSQKILILPALQEAIPAITDKRQFKPRAYIRGVHETYTNRIVAARSFLQPSTSTHPRLVLMNGGSVGARTACVSSISENMTNGDVAKAEIIFNEIVKDGVAGLLAHEDEEVETVQPDDTHESTVKIPETEENEEDPIVRAMKAADSLDRETAALQDEAAEVTMLRTVDGTSDDQKAVTPEVCLEAAEKTEEASEPTPKDDIRTTEIIIPSRQGGLQDGLSTFGGAAGDGTPFTAGTFQTARHSHSNASVTDDDDYDTDMASPSDDVFSVPPTPRVEYGEACIVDVQSTSSQTDVRRTRSMEELYRRGIDQAMTTPPRKLHHAKSEYNLGGRPTSASGRIEDPLVSGFIQLPRTTFMRAVPTTIRTTQSMYLPGASSSASTPTVRRFVDCGTDAWDGQEPEEVSFQPVFPAVEDLVVHCISGSPSEILSSVFQAYRKGTYPTAPDSPISDDDDSVETPTEDEADAEPAVKTTPVKVNTQEEFDPYSSDTTYLSTPIPKLGIPRSKFAPAPPSPARTLPLPSNMVEDKFCELPMPTASGVISNQNALREFLNLRFPAGENGYTQYNFPTAPEADRLWKPIFGSDPNAGVGEDGRTFDQIIALGCEDGVRKAFFNQISGQVERLGTKRDGLSRSGKIDLRYLVSCAMQTFSALPTISRGTANPFTSSSLLATLIVPHIETYLATNPSVRLLVLIYPSFHLPTVVALRKLLGQEVLRIAGILDALSSDPRPRTPSLTNTSGLPKAQNIHGHRRQGSRKSEGSEVSQKSVQFSKKSELSFSKANYLLPSTATDYEIFAFLSGILKPLVERCSYYAPEPEVEPIVVEKIVERPVDRKPAPPPKPTVNSNSPRQGRESKFSRLAGNLTEKRYAPSIASTVQTMTTVRSTGTRRTTRTTATEKGRRDERDLDKAWEDFYIGEVDSEDDEYDRMVMGRAGARIVPEVVKHMQGKKRSSKKALKWLGLA